MTTRIKLLTIGLATALLATSAVGAFANPVLTLGHGPVIITSGSGIHRGFPSGGSDSGLHRGPIYPVGSYGYGDGYGYGYGGGGDWWWDHHHHHHHHHHHEYPL